MFIKLVIRKLMKSALLITAAFLLTSCASAPVAEAAPTPQPTVVAAVAKKELTLSLIHI